VTAATAQSRSTRAIRFVGYATSPIEIAAMSVNAVTQVPSGDTATRRPQARQVMPPLGKRIFRAIETAGLLQCGHRVASRVLGICLSEERSWERRAAHTAP
jgi:hypothetical protein